MIVDCSRKSRQLCKLRPVLAKPRRNRHSNHDILCNKISRLFNFGCVRGIGTCTALNALSREKWNWLRLENLRMMMTLHSFAFRDTSDHPYGCTAAANSFCKNFSSLLKLLQLHIEPAEPTSPSSSSTILTTGTCASAHILLPLTGHAYENANENANENPNGKKCGFKTSKNTCRCSHWLLSNKF